jgi:hypothetical protein
MSAFQPITQTYLNKDLMSKIHSQLQNLLKKDGVLRPLAEEILKKLEIPLDNPPTSSHSALLVECLQALDSGTPLEELPQLKTSAIQKSDRPMPELIKNRMTVQEVDLEGIPLDKGIAEKWAEVARLEAEQDADYLVGAPFDGIELSSEGVRAQAQNLKQHGFNLHAREFVDAMQEPERIKRVSDRYMGKFQERRNSRQS